MVIKIIPNYRTLKQFQQKQNISFQGKIIDAHSHLGKWSSDNVDFKAVNLDEVIKDSFEITINGKKQTDEVEKVLVSNLSCINRKDNEDELSGNKKLLIDTENNPKIKPIAVCKPGHGNPEKIEQLLKENQGKFYGLKFHPMGLDFSADKPEYEPYMKLAEKYKLPCVFHADRVGTCADPNLIYELAKKTTEVPVVLYHMSLASGESVANLEENLAKQRNSNQNLETIKKLEDEIDSAKQKLVANRKDTNTHFWDIREIWNRDGIAVVKKAVENKDANLYLDVSWVDPKTVVEAIKDVGSDRVLFGTDAPLGEFGKKEFYAKRVKELKVAITNEFGDKAEEIIDKVFYKNAEELFFTKNWAKKIQEPVKSAKKSNNGLIALGAVVSAGVVGFGAYLYNKNNQSSEEMYFQ